MCLCSVTQLCPPLCNPIDCSLPGFSVHEILQARILGWVAISFSKGSSAIRDGTHISCISYIGRLVLYNWATWKPKQLGRKDQRTEEERKGSSSGAVGKQTPEIRRVLLQSLAEYGSVHMSWNNIQVWGMYHNYSLSKTLINCIWLKLSQRLRKGICNNIPNKRLKCRIHKKLYESIGNSDKSI